MRFIEDLIVIRLPAQQWWPGEDARRSTPAVGWPGVDARLSTGKGNELN